MRRLLDHIEHKTTDVADDLLEIPADAYVSRARHDDELAVLTFDSRHIELWQILPVDVDRSQVIHQTYLRPGLHRGFEAALADARRPS